MGDIDNDGFEDIYVTNFGRNRLYRNSGGRFEDVAEKAGVAVDSWTTGCAFGDYDGDGASTCSSPAMSPWISRTFPLRPVVRREPGPPRRLRRRRQQRAASAWARRYSAGLSVCTYRGQRVMCGPRGLNGAPDHLFRNNGDGTFTEVSKDAGVDDPRGLYGFGVAWFDMDDDGRLDLLVANDSGPNHVYRNLGNGRFGDVSYPSGAALEGNGREQAHMGVAIGDYDNDGRNDIHITNFADDFNVLYRNDDGGALKM